MDRLRFGRKTAAVILWATAAGVWHECAAKDAFILPEWENLFPNPSFEGWTSDSKWPQGDGVTWNAEALADEMGNPLFAYFGMSDRMAHSGKRSFYIKDEYGGGCNNVLNCILPSSVAKAAAGKGLKLSVWAKLESKNAQGTVGISIRVGCHESPMVSATAAFPREALKNEGFENLSCCVRVPEDAKTVVVSFLCANGWYGRAEVYYDDVELRVIPQEEVPETEAERAKRLRKPFQPNRAAMEWVEKWNRPMVFRDDGHDRPEIKGGNFVSGDGSYFYPIGPWVHPKIERDWNEKTIKRHGIDHPAYVLPPGKRAFDSVGCTAAQMSAAPKELGEAIAGYAKDATDTASKVRKYRENLANFENTYMTVDFAFGYNERIRALNPDLAERIDQRRNGWHNFIPFCPECPEGRDYYRSYIGMGAKLVLAAKLNVGIWELFNESAYGCECASNKEAFASCARRTYGSIGAANSVWNTSFKDFDELMRAKDFGRYKGLWNEWCAFIATRYTEVLDEYRRLIRSFDKRERVYFTEQLWIYQIWDGMTDYRKIAETMDTLSIEGGWGYGGGVDGMKARDEMEAVVFGGSLHWYVLDFFNALTRGRKPVLNNELYCSRIEGGKRVPSRATDLVTSLWLEFFHGLAGSHMYIWEKRANEWSTFDEAKANVLSPSYKSNALLNPYNWPISELDAFRRFGTELAKYQNRISEFPRTIPASVAIYHSQVSSAMALKFGRPIKMPMVRAYATVLHDLYPTTFVFSNELTEGHLPEGIQAIVVPAADFETKSVCRALERFMANGGLVIADKGAFSYDEHGCAADGPPSDAVIYDASRNTAQDILAALRKSNVRKTAELIPLDGKGEVVGADVQLIDRGDFKLAIVVNMIGGKDIRKLCLSSLPLEDNGIWDVFDGVSDECLISPTGKRQWTSEEVRKGIPFELPYQERVLIGLRRPVSDACGPKNMQDER